MLFSSGDLCTGFSSSTPFSMSFMSKDELPLPVSLDGTRLVDVSIHNRFSGVELAKQPYSGVQLAKQLDT